MRKEIGGGILAMVDSTSKTAVKMAPIVNLDTDLEFIISKMHATDDEHTQTNPSGCVLGNYSLFGMQQIKLLNK